MARVEIEGAAVAELREALGKLADRSFRALVEAVLDEEAERDWHGDEDSEDGFDGEPVGAA